MRAGKEIRQLTRNQTQEDSTYHLQRASVTGHVYNSRGLFLLKILDESERQVSRLFQYVHVVVAAGQRQEHAVFVLHLKNGQN